ncbi:uncharacterized protein LOC117104384, partial [Anneissia japonica]|uniref:uncharacterized protein LOC117104384 n=1 Tax=Anneissia japonica TaxID=1529436 RepID=UPI0014258123
PFDVSMNNAVNPNPMYPEINDECYSLLHSSRINRTGGGVAIYLDQNLQYTVRNDLSNLVSTTAESIFIEIKAEPKNIILGTVYGVPDLSLLTFNSDISFLLDVINNENKKTYIAGDFNIDLLKYSTHKQSSEFLGNMFNYNLYPLIHRPTRITTKTATLIDNIFTNNMQTKISPGILYSDISDHFPIYSIVHSNLSHSLSNNNNNIKYS